MSEVSLDEKVAFLRTPGAYLGAPEAVEAVEAIETHMSWVFLTRRSAYKLKKPIRYDRLDFTTLERRRLCCEEEVRLNRRLAEEIYLGTLPLTREDDGQLAIGGRGRPIDWLVHMRRLPADQMLDAIIERRTVEKSEVEPVARRLADFFATASPVDVSSDALRARFEEGIRVDREELSKPEFGLDRRRVATIAASELALLDEYADLFEARVREGRIVEGHGDLRPEHVCLHPRPVVIDCLEFCRELRELDPVDELAFLALECERLGQTRIGDWFLAAYRERTGDPIPEPLLAFYREYRILRRARIAIWHLRDPSAPGVERYAERARHYIELAQPWTG